MSINQQRPEVCQQDNRDFDNIVNFVSGSGHCDLDKMEESILVTALDYLAAKKAIVDLNAAHSMDVKEALLYLKERVYKREESAEVVAYLTGSISDRIRNTSKLAAQTAVVA